MKPIERLRRGGQDHQRHDRPEEPDERALEDERPADEGIGRADQAHDLDLLGTGDDSEADRVDDDEQDDDSDDEQDGGASRAQDARHGQDPVDEILDVDHVAHDRLLFGLERVADGAQRGRVLELDLEAGVERVAVELLGEVGAALAPPSIPGIARAPLRG